MILNAKMGLMSLTFKWLFEIIRDGIVQLKGMSALNSIHDFDPTP